MGTCGGVCYDGARSIGDDVPVVRTLVSVAVLVLVAVLCICFFFSSRRRHTRFDCDWSSDVCSSDLMLELFRKHLKPVSEKQCHIERCIPFRFRCRQSTSRCVLQYTLRVVEPVTGRQWDQWVTGVVYARDGEAERLWRQLHAEDPRRAT